jgi:hypothetical protein
MVFLLILLIRLRLVGWREFEEMDVWEVVKAMYGDKPPGSYGFSMAFF